MTHKIGVLFTNYGPYHVTRVTALHNYIKGQNWQVVGIELARSEADYPWKNQVTNLPFSIVSLIQDRQLEQTGINRIIQKLYAVLDEVNPDVIAIAGYGRLTMFLALLWSLWHRKPAILLSETTENDAQRYNWQETIKSSILKMYKVALVGGKPHKRYLVKLGMFPDAIFCGYDVVGNEIFHPDKIKPLPQPLARPYFLAINRFVPKKNLLFLISSYAAYRQSAGSHAWDLVLCGNGDLRPEIEQLITELSLQDVVHLPGFLQQDELLPYFAHAGCFVHSSIQEQWGLVVNEAMAAGLPVLVSNRCGCFEDLMIEGVNGFGFDPENPQQLTNLMLKISLEQMNLKAMGEASLKHIQKFSPDYFAQGLMQAVEYAIARR